MAFIHDGSEATMLLENHLFYLPSTLTERWNTKDYDVGPSQATFDEANDIQFTVAASQNEFISLADIRFSCDLVLHNSQGRTIQQEDFVAPVNNILHSLFQTVSVQLNGRALTDPSNMYHYRAYLESLLGYTTKAQESQLTCAGFSYTSDMHYTTVKEVDKVKAFEGGGVRNLQTFIVGKNTIQLSGKLHSDIFQQDRPLVPGVEMSIRLVRNKVDLSFVSASKDTLPKVALRNPRLRVRKYEPSPDFFSAFSKQLLTTTAKYHIERVQMKQLTLIKGQQQAVWSNLVIGQLPKIMLFGMVPSEGFGGAYNKTPFNFHHFHLSTLSAEIDGQLYPTRGYELNFGEGMYLTAYEGLLDTLERLNEPSGEVPFNRLQYAEGFTIYGFDFTPGHTGRGSLSLIKQGNLNVNIRFEKSLAEGVVCIAMLVYDNIIEINNNRQVIFDFAP